MKVTKYYCDECKTEIDTNCGTRFIFKKNHCLAYHDIQFCEKCLEKLIKKYAKDTELEWEYSAYIEF